MQFVIDETYYLLIRLCIEAGIQSPEQPETRDTSSMRKAKEFFDRKANAETPSTQPKIKPSSRRKFFAAVNCFPCKVVPFSLT